MASCIDNIVMLSADIGFSYNSHRNIYTLIVYAICSNPIYGKVNVINLNILYYYFILYYLVLVNKVNIVVQVFFHKKTTKRQFIILNISMNKYSL